MTKRIKTKIVPILLTAHHINILDEQAKLYTNKNRSLLLRILIAHPQFSQLLKEVIDETWKKE